jgi:hypothetical protein
MSVEIGRIARALKTPQAEWCRLRDLQESYGMKAIEPSGGHVVLRGRRIEAGTDIYHQFAIDCCRFIENLIDEQQLRKKYGLLTDAQWRDLSEIEPLQLLIGKIKEERVRSGEAQREKAAIHWLAAVDTVHAIVQDPTAPSRARLDGARELRACAVGTADDKPDERSRFTININFGTAKIHREIELTPVKHDDGDDLPEPRETGIVNYTR